MPKPIKPTLGPASHGFLYVDDEARASVDIPIDVLAAMMIEVLRRDLLTVAKTEELFQFTAESLSRRDARGFRAIH